MDARERSLSYLQSLQNSDGRISSRRNLRHASVSLHPDAISRMTSNSRVSDDDLKTIGPASDTHISDPDRNTVMRVMRPVYTQQQFQQQFDDTPIQPQVPVGVAAQFSPSSWTNNIHSFNYYATGFLSFFPIINVIRFYNAKKNGVNDLLAGVTTGVMRIPQSMAYALLALLAPVHGLYTAFFAGIVYIVFGSSAQLVMGAQGVVAVMIGSAVQTYFATYYNIQLQSSSHIGHNSSYSSDGVNIETAKIEIVNALTMLTGLVQIALGICHLGFITNFFSDPLIGGFTNGSIIQVLISLVPSMLGIVITTSHGIFKSINTLRNCVHSVTDVNIATALISILSFLLMVSIKVINFKLKNRLKIPIPAELIVIILSIIFSYAFNLEERLEVDVVGKFQTGLPSPTVPNFELFPRLLLNSFVIGLVAYSISVSLAKQFAIINAKQIRPNQEFFAYGITNVCSSFFCGFICTSSMSCSALNQEMGARSQISNVYACIIVFIALIALGPLFALLPNCVLSVIILVNVKTLLWQFKDLKPLWKTNKIDFLIWVVTWTAVVLLDVDIGLGVGVAFSLLTIVHRSQWPNVCSLGRIPCTDIYKNRAVTPNAVLLPGISIVRFEGSLYFASAEHITRCIFSEAGCNPREIIAEKKEYFKKLAKVKNRVKERLDTNGPLMLMKSWFKQNKEKNPLLPKKSKERYCPKAEIHHVILDFSTCGFMDSVGQRTISQMILEYQSVDVTVYLASVRAAVRQVWSNSEYFNGEHIFISVHDAVLTALEVSEKSREIESLVQDSIVWSQPGTVLAVSPAVSDTE